jgi:CRP/FNR family transcriptional regulator, cyclic AMP receptor protein
VPADALEDLARQCRWRRYAAGQQVISRDAADSDVYLIVSGQVRATAFSASGRQVGYGEMRSGQWFGDFAAIDGLSRSADVVAIEETLVAAMHPALFRSLLHTYPEVCDRMLRRLVACVRELTERVFDFSTLGVQNRVHAELLRIAKHAGVQGNRVRIDPAPRHSDIAGRISTYREQVSRELSEMAKQGLVQRDGSALVIPDVGRLERLVAEVRSSA